ncbi:hypothetical protein HY948_00695 [Candidatus Gottesmanbacteria bacterium]|nr:hypothetical protein [Candidatus Gottesmanbacteria bacterium]
MFKSKNALLVGPLILVVAAIAVTAILDRTKQADTASGDIRTRASATGSLSMTATVASVDQIKGTIMVDNLRFDNKNGGSTGNSLGSWTVTAPQNINLNSLFPGTKVTLIVSPSTFLTTSHTLTATDIKVQK